MTKPQYCVLKERKIRRLVDANILGICISNLEGAIIEANEAFLRMLQYSREDVVSRRLRWTDLTPAEWREQNERSVAELHSTGFSSGREGVLPQRWEPRARVSRRSAL